MIEDRRHDAPRLLMALASRGILRIKHICLYFFSPLIRINCKLPLRIMKDMPRNSQSTMISNAVAHHASQEWTSPLRSFTTPQRQTKLGGSHERESNSWVCSAWVQQAQL